MYKDKKQVEKRWESMKNDEEESENEWTQI